MKSLAFEKNEILFGCDPQPGLVAVEPVGDDAMRLFIREASGLVTKDEPFRPFLLLEDQALLKGFRAPHETVVLSGDNSLRVLVFFENWSDCRKARTYVHKKTGITASSPQAPYLFVSDPVHQYLLMSGKTLFKGLPFHALHRLALDIETACAPGYEFSNPRRTEDRILSVALLDNRGYAEVLFGKDMDERDMLLAVGERVTRLDPDIIEGHNFFNFDLAYIKARADLHGVALHWGRDGSTPRVRRSRFTAAERVIDYARMDIFGRHLVDTMFLLQSYDVSARELESYGLKAAARHFGLSAEDRTLIEGHRIQWYYDHQPDVLRKYNLDDVRETLALSELLSYSYFLQARIFPFTYQNIFVRGNATKINALFLRAYLKERTAIPKPRGGARFEGGYTDVFVTGLVRNVVHCDVASLYPSILLSYGLKPSGDALDVFLPLLKNLREFRLEAKKRAGEASSSHDRDYYQALQQTFKVLINSFYGYLGTDRQPFADPEVAAEVTRRGRAIIRNMIAWLRDAGALPVEIDTDGIYFVPPPGMETRADVDALVQRLSETLPEGIDVHMDGRYGAMFSYMRKNYALLDEAGHTVIKGSALRSRGMEKYLRAFLSDMLRLILEGKGQAVPGLLDAYRLRLDSHEEGIGWVAKTETLRESPEIYRQKVQEKKRNPAALYELALASGREYRAGDQLSYYVTGDKKKVRVYDHSKPASLYDPDHPDENVPYYQAKLLALFKKFEPFMPS